MIGLGIGVAWAYKKINRYIANLILSFRLRVLAAGGVFEAESCLENQLSSLQGIGLLNDASLLVTPNAYKASVLYDVIPNTTLGDLDVVRATSATRVDANGLVEIPRTNLATYSEDFTNSSWDKITSGASVSIPIVTPNSAISPDGTMNADLIEFTPPSNVDYSICRKTISLNNSLSGSIYLKAFDESQVGKKVGIYIVKVGDVQGTVLTLTNEWQRVIISRTNDAYVEFTFGKGRTTWATGGITQSESASKFYAWGAQLEVGNAATEYIPTVASVRTKFAGITQDGSSASNIPRLDYTNGSCPSILVEPQRTNLVTYSEQFDNAIWIPTSATITANSVISPSGILNADTFSGNGVINGFRLLGCTSTSAVGVTSISVFAKKNTNNFIQLIGGSTVFGVNVWANFDLNNGTLGTIGSATTAKIENYGNGWYRCTIIGTSTLAGSPSFNIGLVTSATSVRAESNTLTTSVFLWGAQMELGANATSYIPTTTATVTRNADVISKTGISSLIGQTEGTLFVDVNYKAEGIQKNYLNLGTSTSSYIAIGARTNNKIAMEVLNSVVQVNASSTATYSTNQRLKIAMTYKLNDFKLYVNGILQATDTIGTVPAKAEVYLGSYGNGTNQSMDGINLAAIYKTVLTDEQLIQLTTI
jgi:hypothetical protein